MHAMIPLAAIVMLAACSKPAGAPANNQATVITDMNATAPATAPPSTDVGFVCNGTQKGLGPEEMVKAHFVLRDKTLFELSEDSGQLEETCESGFDCQTTVKDVSIEVFQEFTDSTTVRGTSRKVHHFILINRLTGYGSESFETTYSSVNYPAPSTVKWQFVGQCENELPQTMMKPKF